MNVIIFYEIITLNIVFLFRLMMTMMILKGAPTDIVNFLYFE